MRPPNQYSSISPCLVFRGGLHSPRQYLIIRFGIGEVADEERWCLDSPLQESWEECDWMRFLRVSLRGAV